MTALITSLGDFLVRLAACAAVAGALFLGVAPALGEARDWLDQQRQELGLDEWGAEIDAWHRRTNNSISSDVRGRVGQASGLNSSNGLFGLD